MEKSFSAYCERLFLSLAIFHRTRQLKILELHYIFHIFNLILIFFKSPKNAVPWSCQTKWNLFQIFWRIFSWLSSLEYSKNWPHKYLKIFSADFIFRQLKIKLQPDLSSWIQTTMQQSTLQIYTVETGTSLKKCTSYKYLPYTLQCRSVLS